MKKLKICVYAICKNEEKFIKRWVESMSEADYICVLDTGSTDNSYNLLKENNVITRQQEIKPWRFDVARNESMKLIPEDTDICVCTDLDELFEKGWRKKIEDNITENTKLIQYRYTWNFNEDGSEGFVFYANKIHAYGEFYWKYPVHEVITHKTNEPFEVITIKDLQLNHYADNAKSRGQYLQLLELSVKECPTDDRNVHYLGREYFFYGQYEKAIETLKKHLLLPTSTWKDERSASMRYIAKSYQYLNDYENAKKFFNLSIIETPDNREPYYELGYFYYTLKDYINACSILESMFNIKERKLNYISDPKCWSALPYEILCLCYYNLGYKVKALTSCVEGLKIEPENKNLIYNFDFIKNNLN